MSQAETSVGSSIVAVYPDHAAAEEAIRQLHEAGFPMSDLSIIGRNYQTTEEPVGFISTSDYATAGAKTGASFGGLLGLLVGSAFLVLPGGRSGRGRRSARGFDTGGNRRGDRGDGAGQPGGRARRLGCPEGPGTQVRDPDRGRQVHRPRSRRPGRHRPRAEPARFSNRGAHGSLRTGGIRKNRWPCRLASPKNGDGLRPFELPVPPLLGTLIRRSRGMGDRGPAMGGDSGARRQSQLEQRDDACSTGVLGNDVRIPYVDGSSFIS